MFRSVLPLLLLVGFCLATNSTLCSSPNIHILSPSGPPTYLLLNRTCFIYDLEEGKFYTNLTTSYVNSGISKVLPVAWLSGDLLFQAPALMLLSYDNTNSSYCSQAISAPPLCPFLQTLTEGPFVFGTFPRSGNVQHLSIEASTSNPNPKNPYGPLNFLGANQAITYTCVGTCEELQSQVPLPENVTYMVRRSHYCNLCYNAECRILPLDPHILLGISM